MKFSTILTVSLATASAVVAQAVVVDSFEGSTTFVVSAPFTSAFSAVGVTDGASSLEFSTVTGGFAAAMSSFDGSLQPALLGATSLSIDVTSITSAATFLGVDIHLNGSGGFKALGSQFLPVNSTGTLTWNLDSAAQSLVAASTGPGSFFGLQVYFNSNLAGSDLVYLDNLSAVPEPSTYAAIAGALALGVAVLRRRSKTSV
jgi:hypothetical protein